MNEIVKPAAILLIITAVAAMLLGVVSETTKEAIAAQSAKTEQTAMEAVLPGEGLEFESVLDVAAGDDAQGTISKISKAISNGETLVMLLQLLKWLWCAVNTMIALTQEGVSNRLKYYLMLNTSLGAFPLILLSTNNPENPVA